MDNINLLSIFSVSYPEEFLNLIVGFLIIGERKRLFSEKNSILTFILTASLMVLSSCLVRKFIPSIIAVLLLNVAIYSVIIKITYNMSFKKTIPCVLFFTGLIVVVEPLFVMPFAMETKDAFSVFVNTGVNRLLMSLPERLIQGIVIAMLWSRDLILINLVKYDRVKRYSNTLITLQFVANAALTYILVYNATNIVMDILLLTAIAIASISNLLIFKIITVFTSTIRIEVLNNSEHKNLISIVNRLLKSNNVEKAKELTEKAI